LCHKRFAEKNLKQVWDIKSLRRPRRAASDYFGPRRAAWPTNYYWPARRHRRHEVCAELYTSDSFSWVCIVLLIDWMCSFAITFSIIQALYKYSITLHLETTNNLTDPEAELSDPVW